MLLNVSRNLQFAIFPSRSQLIVRTLGGLKNPEQGVKYIQKKFSFARQNKGFMLAKLHSHQKGTIAVMLAALLWSTGGLFIKLLPMVPMSIVGYRSLLSALFFGLLFGRKVFRMNRVTFGVSLIYAGVLITYVVAIKLTTAANAIFLQYTAPVYVMLLEPLLFKLKLERINILTIVLSFLGLSLFFVGDMGGGSGSNPGLGNFLSLLSGFLLASELLLLRVNDPEYYEASIFWGNIWVALVSIPWMISDPISSSSSLWMLLFLGFIQVGLGNAFFTYGLKRVLAVEAALIAMLEPLFNPVWVFLGYGEVPTFYAMIGGGIILVSLAFRTWYVERSKRRLVRRDG